MPTSGSPGSRATADAEGGPEQSPAPLAAAHTDGHGAGTTGGHPSDAERIGILRLLRLPGYRRLLGVRFPAQFSDGMFQTALGGAVLFNPERQADPIAVAAGLAVLLLPYSVIGPFAGALLDRWDRKRVLVVASLVRALLVVGVAATVYAGADGPPLYLGALLVAGLSRFVGAGLSVGLPHLVPRANLVQANAFAVTVGAGGRHAGAHGDGVAIVVRAFVGADDAGSL